MRNRILIVTVAFMCVTVHGEVRKVDFEQDTVGQPPKGFVFGHTRKVGTPGRWAVQQEGGGKYLAQLDADGTRNRFPVAVLTDVSATDVDVSVRFRPVSGRVDQAGGLVWRYQNEDNYYIVRANALEDTVVLYKVPKCQPPNGARCVWSRQAHASRCTSTARSCMRWRIRRSKEQAASAYGRRLTRLLSLTT
jgi:hypothetical protein